MLKYWRQGLLTFTAKFQVLKRSIPFLPLMTLVAIAPSYAQEDTVIKSSPQTKGSFPESFDSLPVMHESTADRDMVARYGTIIDSKKLGAGGITAWTVKNGQGTVILYTTFGNAIFTGVVWDGITGKNLSDQFYNNRPLVRAPVEKPVVRLAAAFDGKFSGDLPESIKTVESLAGIKEGDGGPADTLYIIVDSRCPRSRLAYKVTRPYIEKGFTIKWIPTTALGDFPNGVQLAATMLQSNSKETLERQLGLNAEIKTVPTQATLESLKNNLAFLLAAYEHNGGNRAGVPTAFFIDRRLSKPRMYAGVSNNKVLADIFGPL